jgi:hypothetical protein
LSIQLQSAVVCELLTVSNYPQGLTPYLSLDGIADNH